MEPDRCCSRRDFVRFAGRSGAALTALACLPTARGAAPQEYAAPSAVKTGTPDAVLRELLEGNERFVRGQLHSPRRRPEDFLPLSEGQSPRAVIVGCADSRVPPEILFDQGVGDLFVVRVAGNVVSGAGATVKGSIEYAVAELRAPLILVLGHSGCGAVKAAIKHIDIKDNPPGAIGELVDLIKPSVAKVRGQPGNLLENAIRSNVQMGADRLRTLDPILAGPVKADTLKVIGATYDLRTGRVSVLE
jgi:carbonic anhydrase